MSDGASILIIEDDQDLASSMRVTLEAEKFQVTSVEDPEKGVEEARRKKPDLIILDVMFGESQKTRGFDCALELKQDKVLAPVPILMVTAVNIRHKGFHFSPNTDGEYLPVDDFIDKPAQPEDLVQKVKELLKKGVSKWKNWPHPPSQD